MSLSFHLVILTQTNPIDVIKTRLQLQGELGKPGVVAESGAVAKSGDPITQSGKHYKGFVRGIGRIVMDEGISGLYKGYV